MEALKAIRYLLVNDADVAAVVGGRVYSFTLPQEQSMPAIVLSVVGNRPNHSKDGTSEVDEIRMQVTAIGRTQSQCVELSRKIRAAIDQADGGTFAGVAVQSIYFDQQVGLYEFERNVPMVANDFTVRVTGVDYNQSPNFQFKGRYVDDDAAIANGLVEGDLYVLSVNTLAGMVGLLKRVGTSGIKYHANDGAALAAGLVAGDYYYLSLENEGGMYAGVVKRIGLTNAVHFASDAAAIAGNYSVGNLYYLSIGNLYGVTEGLVKLIEP